MAANFSITRTTFSSGNSGNANPFTMQFNPGDKMPKYKQIVRSIIMDIERGRLKTGNQLPSISELSIDYLLARDTVEKAYRELRAKGYITSVQGKGYYVKSETEKKTRILLVFNKLSSYKKIIYDSFLKAMGPNTIVDLHIYHYDARRFKEIIEDNLGKYNYYVIMPHFSEDADRADTLEVLRSIPAGELVLLDKDVPELQSRQKCVFQNFDRDIFGALENVRDLLFKYDHLTLIFPESGNYPSEIQKGFRDFCVNYNISYNIDGAISADDPLEGTAYIAIEEADLADLIKRSRLKGLKLGENTGLISFNETTLKELLGITVITTDFEKMGATAANMLLTGESGRIKNPFHVIRRGSL